MFDFFKDLIKIASIIFAFALILGFFGWLIGAKNPDRAVNEYNAIFDQIDKDFIESQKLIIIDSNEHRNL